MHESLEILAQRKHLLQARSTLYRLRIRSALGAMQRPLSWARAGVRMLLVARLASIAANLLRSSR